MDLTNLPYAIVLTLIAGLATGIGGLVVFFTNKFNGKFLALSLGFSAGVMIFISLVEIFNEARESLSILYGDKQGMLYSLLAFFGGIGIIAIIDRLIPESNNPHELKTTTLEEAKEAAQRNSLMKIGIVSALAISIHNFPEGIATFVTAMNDPALGASIAFAIAIHNIPEGIAVAIPLYFATRNKGKAFLASLASGLAEPIGGLIGFFLLASIFNESFMGIILAGVAGIMVYISLDELLPAAEKYGEHHLAIIGIIAGMAFMGFSLVIM